MFPHQFMSTCLKSIKPGYLSSPFSRGEIEDGSALIGNIALHYLATALDGALRAMQLPQDM